MTSRLFLFVGLMLSANLRADLLKVADFETGDLSQMRMQKAMEDGIIVVDSPVRSGKHAARTLLRASDPQVSKGQRSEFIDNKTKIEMNRDYWYGLSIMLAPDFKPRTKSNAVLFQWHTQQGGPSPVLAIRVEGNEWIITSNATPDKRRTLKRIPLEKGKWVDWVIHAKWASTPTGYWTIWKDGVEVVSEKDIVTQYPEELGPYAKFGQYHSVDEEGQNTVFVDEYRVGDSKSGYREVAPSQTDPAK